MVKSDFIIAQHMYVYVPEKPEMCICDCYHVRSVYALACWGKGVLLRDGQEVSHSTANKNKLDP